MHPRWSIPAIAPTGPSWEATVRRIPRPRARSREREWRSVPRERGTSRTGWTTCENLAGESGWRGAGRTGRHARAHGTHLYMRKNSSEPDMGALWSTNYVYRGAENVVTEAAANAVLLQSHPRHRDTGYSRTDRRLPARA